jgi:hypothetical protein
LLIGFGIILAHLAWESLKLAPFGKRDQAAVE